MHVRMRYLHYFHNICIQISVDHVFAFSDTEGNVNITFIKAQLWEGNCYEVKMRRQREEDRVGD